MKSYFVFGSDAVEDCLNLLFKFGKRTVINDSG